MEKDKPDHLMPPLTATDKIYWNGALRDFLAIWPMTEDDTAHLTASIEGTHSVSTGRIATVVMGDTPIGSSFVAFLKGYVCGRTKQVANDGGRNSQ
jgi:hypothetical protein